MRQENIKKAAGKCRFNFLSVYVYRIISINAEATVLSLSSNRNTL